MKLSQVLARAAKLVERGWCQGYAKKVSRGKTYYCAYGALAPSTQALVFFMQFIDEPESLGEWNDEPGRTGAEVATWLASCAEWAKVMGK